MGLGPLFYFGGFRDRVQDENGGFVDSLLAPVLTSNARINCRLARAHWGAHGSLRLHVPK